MSSTNFFNSIVFQRFFKPRKESLISSGSPVAKLSSDIVFIVRGWLNEDCLLTLEEISKRLVREYGISIGQDKIACCFNSIHFSIERIPFVYPFKYQGDTLLLLRKVFADNFMEIADRMDLFFVGTTKVNVNTRVYQGKKASPQWAIKSKTFTISAALHPDKLFAYEIQDTSYNYKESPNNSPDKPEPPYKFVNFFRKFTKQLEAEGIKNANIIMEGSNFHHLITEDRDLLRSTKLSHKIDILPGNSPDFNPLEVLFDSLRYIVEKFEPTDPESVFNSLKKLPEKISELECSYYFSDALNYIQVTSDMRF